MFFENFTEKESSKRAKRAFSRKREGAKGEVKKGISFSTTD